MKVRCSRCKHVFRVDVEAPASAGTAARRPAEAMAKPKFGVESTVARPTQGEPREGRPIFGDGSNPFAMDDPFAHTMAPQGPPSSDSVASLGSGDEIGGFDVGGGEEADAGDMFDGLFDREDPFAETSFVPPTSAAPARPAFSPPAAERPRAVFGAPVRQPGAEEVPGLMASPSGRAAQGPPPGAEPDDFGQMITRGTASMDDFVARPSAAPVSAPAPSGEISQLGDMARAGQFSLDHDSGEFEVPGGAQAFFDPDREQAAPAAPVKRTSGQPARTFGTGARDLELDDSDGIDLKAAFGPDSDELEAPKLATSAPPSSGGRSMPPASVSRISGSRRAVDGRDQDVIPPAPPVSELEVSGDKSVPQTIANLLLIVLLVAMGFLGFVAARNGGVLDFGALGMQTAVAFGKVDAPAKAPAEDVAEVVEDKAPVRVESLEQVVFPNARGASLQVVEGAVANVGDAPLRNIHVTGTVLDTKGEVVEMHSAPAARSLSEEELLGITDAESLEKAYSDIQKEADALILQPRQAARFSVVFTNLGEAGIKDRTFKVVVESFDEAAP